MLPEDDKRLTQRCLNLDYEELRRIPLTGEISNEHQHAMKRFIDYVADYQEKDMGNSKAHVSRYAFPSQKGMVRVWCTQYDKKTGFNDTGAVSIASEDYIKFMQR